MDRVAEELKIEVVDLSTLDISAYDYDHRNRTDDFEPLMEKVLRHEQIIFSSPVYWYAVAPPMKIFLDRISDYLDLPDLLEQGRRLRGKTGYIVCTSIEDDVCAPFTEAFRETFKYLGMEYGGCVHANCNDGYKAEEYEQAIGALISAVRA
jgi:multimeric flavodoxin WrbA